ncbi:MAG TPA: MarR family transcriptional regulator [Chthonomonadaceae bacterium]|nr:MarR family transcriptional regulator [Chthonomonadaceae bacterium]
MNDKETHFSETKGVQNAQTETMPTDPEGFAWLEHVLPDVMRTLMDSENLDMPLLQLPLAQLRLAQALYQDNLELLQSGQTMGKLSEKLGVRQNALTQAADRLVNHALAERLSDPNDRRIVRLRLTEQGRIWVSERHERRRARLLQLWERHTPAERRTLLAAVRTIEAAVNRLERQKHTSQESTEDVESRHALLHTGRDAYALTEQT